MFTFTYLSYTGTGILIAAIISGFLMGFSPARMVGEYGRTIKLCVISLITIAAMLALGTLTRLSGVDATLGLAFAATGVLYPFFGTMLGWLGRRADRLGHRLQRAVRRTAADHRRAARPFADPDGGGQFVRRRHGQDDRRAVDRRGLDRDQWFGHEGSILRFVFWHSIVLAAWSASSSRCRPMSIRSR